MHPELSTAKSDSETRMPETREWTVMFYFASDNPLAPGTIAQLKAIKNAGYHPDTNIICQFDPHTVNMPVHVFDVNMVEKLKNPGNHSIGFESNDPFVRNLVLDKLWDKDIKAEIQDQTDLDYKPPVPDAVMSTEQNPKESLTTFLNFCRANYPARHYILFIIGHGIVVGNDLFLYDEHGPRFNASATANGGANANEDPTKKHERTANGDPAKKPDPPTGSLLLTDLGEILGCFKANIAEAETPGEFELLGFHSCSMSGVEVALELKGTANYMLASQGPTFVGSWPYRNILIRLFNDVESRELSASNYLIACCLIDKVNTGDDPVSKYLRRRFNGHGSELSSDCLERERELVKHLYEEFNNAELCTVAAFPTANSRPEAHDLFKQRQAETLNLTELRRLNRYFLEETYKEEMTSVQIRNMLTKIFYYYMYNSFDFQLAGYSCDLTLCDLNKVGYVEAPLDKLAEALMKGLDAGKDQGVHEAILLAHWEAQSFYQENYTDLYDFCFRLRDKFKKPEDGSKPAEVITNITDACDAVMTVLKRGSQGDDYGPIVRSEFCGPLYQYSHGLSVFFPWSEPVDNRMWEQQYGRYKMNQKDTDSNDPNSKDRPENEKEISWKKFLQKYFETTMRDTQDAELDVLEAKSHKANLDEKLLHLLQSISTRAFSDGSLGSGGPRDPMGVKGGGLDPTGSDCDCGSIKNYPHTSSRERWQDASRGGNKAREIYPAFGSPDLISKISTQLKKKDPNETLSQG